MAIFAGIVILVFDTPPGSGCEACQDRTNIALAHTKYQGLLPAFIVGVTDGHEMFPRFAQQKDGRNQSCYVAPADILSILKGIDFVIRDHQFLGAAVYEDFSAVPGRKRLCTLRSHAHARFI
jgi:hypothetical protein